MNDLERNEGAFEERERESESARIHFIECVCM